MNVTPHDIAALAETRHRDPALALSIAEQSGKAHDQSMTSRICGIPEPILKETKPDERRSKTNAR